LFLIKLSTRTYFIWKIWCTKRQHLDEINTKQFGKYLKYINRHRSSGPTHPSASPVLSSHAACRWLPPARPLPHRSRQEPVPPPSSRSPASARIRTGTPPPSFLVFLSLATPPCPILLIRSAADELHSPPAFLGFGLAMIERHLHQ
jgi:hypothetical protein